MQQHYFIEPFAVSGDLTPGGIPEGIDTNGYVSYTQGFTFDYQRNLQSDSLAKQIQRVTINSIFNDITTAVQNLQQYGTPEFINAANNNGSNFAYNVGAMVRYSGSGVAPFGVYFCLTANSDAAPTTSNWLNLGMYIASGRKAMQPLITLINVNAPVASTTYPCTISFTPPADGFIDVTAFSAVGNIQGSPYGFKTTTTITGTGVSNVQGTGSTDDPQNMVITNYASAQVTAGDVVTVTVNVITYGTVCGAFQTNLKVSFINGAGIV